MRFIFLLILTAVSALAQVVPEARRVDWIPGVTIGVRGGIPTVTTMYTNIYLAGCDKTGVTNCYTILKALMEACPSNQFLYAPAGIYTNSPSINPTTTGGWVLRGDGTNTIFRPEGHPSNTGLIAIDTTALSVDPIRLHGNHSKGATNLTVVGTDMSSHIGKMVQITRSEQTNDHDIQVMSIYLEDRLMRQLALIETVTDSTNFTISHPLMWDFNKSYDPWIRVGQTPAQKIGFENFSVEGGGGSAFYLTGLAYCWWNHVKVTLFANSDYFLNEVNNLGLEIRSCATYSTNAGSGTALWLATGSYGNWYENNYGWGGSPMFEVNGTSGSAYSYNYSTNAASDPNTGDGAFVGNPFNSHGAHAMMNLFEGNQGTMFQLPDAYFGSASHTVVYKNHLHAWDPHPRNYLPRVLDINRWGTYISAVGNILGSSNRSGWYYNMTNDAYDGVTPTLPTILTVGYTAPGNRNYRSENGSPHWRYPGPQNRYGLVTNTAAIPTNRIAGTFTNATIGDKIMIQGTTPSTNYYYPLNTNWNSFAYYLLTVSDIQPAYIEVNKAIVSTNDHIVYKIGDGSFFNGFHYQHTFPTLLLHGNTDASNGFHVILWDSTGTVSDSNLPPSLLSGVTSTPSWFTNRQYGTNITWPPVSPTNAVLSDWAARSLWEDGDFQGGGAVMTVASVGSLRGLRNLRLGSASGGTPGCVLKSTDGETYNISAEFVVGTWKACKMTASAGFVVCNVELRLDDTPGDNELLDLAIYSHDSMNDRPGSIVGTFSATIASATVTTDAFYTFSPVATIPSSGTYWIVLRSADTGVGIIIPEDNSGEGGKDTMTSDDGVTWSDEDSNSVFNFRVNGQ